MTIPPTGQIVRQYRSREKKFLQLAEKLDLSTHDLGMIDGYRLWAASTRHLSKRPRLLISAGIHGDEPAGVEAVLAWLTGYAAEWTKHLSIMVLPCLNPHGFERDVRYDALGRDPNRLFRHKNTPLVRAVSALLKDMRFDLAVDLHEDTDFNSFYIYESETSKEMLAKAVINDLYPFLSISDAEEVEDIFGSITKNGIIPVPTVDPATLPKWPFGRYLLTFHTDHMVCPETPGRHELKSRIEAHARVLNAACRYLIRA